MGLWDDIAKTLAGQQPIFPPVTTATNGVATGSYTPKPTDGTQPTMPYVTEAQNGVATGGYQPLFQQWQAAQGGGVQGGQQYSPQQVFAGVQQAIHKNPQQQTTADGRVVSPLEVQAYFQKAIAPMLEQIQQHQENAIQQFVSGAGAGNVDQRQLASMQNVNNALAGAAVASPGLDMLMNQVNQALNSQQKAYYEALRAQALGAAGTGTGGVDLSFAGI